MSDQWHEGREAAENGAEVWDNPYSSLTSMQDKFHAWFAGWCYGKRMTTDETE